MNRNLVLRLHGFVGIVTGLLLMVISLTGASIVFHDEIDHALNRSLWHVTPQAEQVSLDEIIAPVQAAYPDLPIWFVQSPKTLNESYVINQKTPNEQRFQTFVNPYTGATLGSRIWERSLTGFLYTLHHELLAGKVGQIIVGVIGILLLLMTLTGVLLWTGWRKLVTGFRIRWHSPVPLVSYDLHKVGGILSSVFFTVIAFTGIVIVVLHVLPIFSPAPEAKPVTKTPTIAWSQLLQKADAAMPDGKTTSIELSETNSQQLTVRKKLPNQDTGRFDFSTVELNRYSGEVVQVSKVVKAEGFFKFLVAIADLHFGTFGRLPTRILYVFIGLMPSILLITGLITWKRRRWLMARREEALLVSRSKPR